MSKRYSGCGLVGLSKQHHSDTTSHFLIRHILLVHSSTYWWRPPVVQVVVQLAVTGTKLQLLQKEGVVLQGEGVEDVEFGLRL